MAYMCVRFGGECDGCGSCQEEKEYYCPICGEKAIETVYISNDGEVVGCENCITTKEPSEMGE